MDAQDIAAHLWKATPAATAAKLSRGRWRYAPHLKLLSAKLAEAAYEPKRILVSMPPRHGKSRLTSRWFPVWFLDRFPDRNVILASYEAAFARSWGRLVRNTIEANSDVLRVRLTSDSKAADKWNTPEEGGMVTAGVKGPITGKGADILVVDDPVKNAEQAYSAVYREAVWDWWTAVAYPRLEPGASAVIVMTRWHEDDLGGRVLTRSDEPWEEIVFPAIATDDDVLGREPGDALWPWRYTEEDLRRIAREVGSWVWAALYQQEPRPAEGGLFKRSWFRYFEFTEDGEGVLIVEPERNLTRRYQIREMARFVVVDLATSTKTQADYTVVSTWGVCGPGHLVLLDVLRERLSGPEHIPAIRRKVDAWNVPVAWIESTAFQLSLVQNARADGLPVRELVRDSDKMARAIAATPKLEAGEVFFPKGAPWLDVFEAEVLAFPRGTHDDQVDVLADAITIARSYLRRPMGIPDPGGHVRPNRYDPSVTGNV